MKKITAFLAVLLALTLVLAGCGEKKDISGDVTPLPENAEEAQENPAKLGRIEGGTYTNAYAGYACDLDANWIFYSAEELQELPEAAKEALEGSEAGDLLEGMTQITDMKAENPENLTIINVLYTKLDPELRLVYATMSEQEILEAVMGEKDMLISSYAQAGILVESMEIETVEFAGETRSAIKTVTTWDGVPYFTLQIFDYHLGSYSVTTTLSCYVEDQTYDMLDLFYSVAD